MFLPSEALYIEALEMGMAEKLQQEFKINIAGPATTAALLNSLRIGFRTLAVEKHSSEVVKVLEEVATEFDTFAGTLDTAKKKIDAAGNEINALITTRTKAMKEKLDNIAKYSDGTPPLDK